MKVRSVFQTEFSFWVNKQSLYEISLLYVKCARLSNVRVCALAAEPQLKKRKEKKTNFFFGSSLSAAVIIKLPERSVSSYMTIPDLPQLNEEMKT